MTKLDYIRVICACLALTAATPSLAEDILMAVVINGSSKYPLSKMVQSYESLLGQAIDSETTKIIASNIRNQYRQDGVLPPAVHIARHNSMNGILLVTVAEPRVAGVRFRGRANISRKLLESRLAELKKITPIHEKAFKQWLQITREQSGLYIEGSLIRRKASPQLYDAVIRFHPRPWSASLQVNNEGTTRVGRELIEGKLSIYGIGPTNIESRLRLVRAAESDELHYLGLNNKQRWGNKLFVLGGYASEVKIRAHTNTIERSYSRNKLWLGSYHELLRRRNSLLKTGIVFSASENFRQVLNTPDRKEQSRKIHTSARVYARQSETRSHTARVLVTAGESRVQEDTPEYSSSRHKYALLDFDYRIEHQLFASSKMQYEISAQYTSQRLPLDERFRVGGISRVSALEPSATSGDKGLSARITWSMPTTTFENIELFSYADGARAWRNGKSSSGRYASSWALGLRHNGERVKATIELARLLEAGEAIQDSGPDDHRFTFSVMYSY